MPTVLIVDDEDDIRSCIQKYMGKHGWSVLEARTYDEAVQLADSCDVMILDYALDADKTGEHVLQALKEKNNLVPVIVISGAMPSREAISRMYDLGIVQYVDKPVRMKDLYESVDRAVHCVEMLDQMDQHCDRLLQFVGATA